MGRGGGGGGRGGGGRRGGDAGGSNFNIASASISQIEEAYTSGRIAPIEAVRELRNNRTEVIDNSRSLQRGDIVAFGGLSSPVQVATITSTGRIRGRELDAMGNPSGNLQTFSRTNRRFKSQEDARAYARALTANREFARSNFRPMPMTDLGTVLRF